MTIEICALRCVDIVGGGPHAHAAHLPMNHVKKAEEAFEFNLQMLESFMHGLKET